MSAMDLLAPVLWLVSGLLLSHVIPRLPLILMSRFSFFNAGLPPHPTAVPVNGHLLARILLMRNLRVLGLMLTLLPLILGWMTVVWAHSPFGVGLVLGSLWTILSWTIPERLGERNWPWTRGLAEDLQRLRNDSADEEKRCCDDPEPMWECASVRCAACLAVLLDVYRPDLGRRRSDGWMKGSVRVWLLDGRSPLAYVDSPSMEEE